MHFHGIYIMFTVYVIVDYFARLFVDHIDVRRRYATPEVCAFEKVQRVPPFLAPYTPTRSAHGRLENGRRRAATTGWRRGGRRPRRRRRRRTRRRRGERRVPSTAVAATGRTQRTARTRVTVRPVSVVVRVDIVFVVVVVVRRILQIIAPRTANSFRVRLRRTGNPQFLAVATMRRGRRYRGHHNITVTV